jgi:hypothetical protein
MEELPAGIVGSSVEVAAPTIVGVKLVPDQSVVAVASGSGQDALKPVVLAAAPAPVPDGVNATSAANSLRLRALDQ